MCSDVLARAGCFFSDLSARHQARPQLFAGVVRAPGDLHVDPARVAAGSGVLVPTVTGHGLTPQTPLRLAGPEHRPRMNDATFEVAVVADGERFPGPERAVGINLPRKVADQT